MKLNKLKGICLLVAALLLGGVFIARASGLVSFEPNADPVKTKIILWDNVRMVAKGLKMSPYGVNDLSDVAGGNIDIQSKDLYVRKFMGFNCASYPDKINCATAIGDVGGNTFLKIDTLNGQNLTLVSTLSGINLKGALIDITGKLILTGLNDGNKNLIATSQTTLPTGAPAGSVFADSLSVSQIKDFNSCSGGTNAGKDCKIAADCPGGSCSSAGLTMPDLKFDDGAIFNTKSYISISL